MYVVEWLITKKNRNGMNCSFFWHYSLKITVLFYPLSPCDDSQVFSKFSYLVERFAHV